ncbi:hypothetical protein Tco_1507419 [Tanacetum coccineum]
MSFLSTAITFYGYCMYDVSSGFVSAVLVNLIVVVVDDVPFISAFRLKSIVLARWACAFHQDKASSVKVPVANVTLSSSAHLLRENTDSVRSNQRTRISLGSVFLLELSEFAMVAACAFRAEEMPSLISCRMASKVMAGVSDVDGRIIEEIDEDENVNLVKSNKQGEAHDLAGHRMESDDTEVVDFSTASPQNDDDEVTLAETLMNIKMSATKKDKGHDEELAQKLHAKELVNDTARQEQERYDFEKALELQKQLDEREKIVAKSQARDIDWSDPAMLRYHAVHNRVWDQNHAFVPKDSEIEKEVMKRSGFDLQQESLKQVEEEIVHQDDVKEDVGYYEIHRADGSYKTYMFFSEMLNDFDREDLIVLYRLFNEKYASTRPGFDDLMLWGDMKIMFEPNDDDAVWKNHHSQELIEWKLSDSYGVHSLMLGEVSIHMLVEKKYPLPQDTLMRMLQWKLHVNYNVTEMAYELLRFIRS